MVWTNGILLPSSVLICPGPLTACQVINFWLNLLLMDYHVIVVRL